MRLIVKEVARFLNSSVNMVNRQPFAKGIVFRYENNKRFREGVEGLTGFQFSRIKNAGVAAPCASARALDPYIRLMARDNA